MRTIAVPRRARTPARLVALLALALLLGAISLSKLRAGTARVAIHHLEAEKKRLPAAEEHGTPAGESGNTNEQQQEQQPQQQQPPEPGACFKQFPWIQPALETFYAPAWVAANASTQSSEEALESLRTVTWGKYHPGMDEVILSLNPQSGRVEMAINEVSKPNQVHKKRCMLGLLQDAVEAHNAELATLLREAGGGKELRLIVETEDFGVTWRAAKWKLPAFAMCTGVAWEGVDSSVEVCAEIHGQLGCAWWQLASGSCILAGCPAAGMWQLKQMLSLAQPPCAACRQRPHRHPGA
jgi:hypothetical protein